MYAYSTSEGLKISAPLRVRVPRKAASGGIKSDKITINLVSRNSYLPPFSLWERFACVRISSKGLPITRGVVTLELPPSPSEPEGTRNFTCRTSRLGEFTLARRTKGIQPPKPPPVPPPPPPVPPPSSPQPPPPDSPPPPIPSPSPPPSPVPSPPKPPPTSPPPSPDPPTPPPSLPSPPPPSTSPPPSPGSPSIILPPGGWSGLVSPPAILPPAPPVPPPSTLTPEQIATVTCLTVAITLPLLLLGYCLVVVCVRKHRQRTQYKKEREEERRARMGMM
ncbi:unnamed protein product [Closterium sp. NIES-53]